MTLKSRFDAALLAQPIIAILRGLKPEEALDIGEALVSAGIKILEVPLNSPQPLVSIARLAKAMSGRAFVGAGTVLSVEDAKAVHSAGGELIISPNVNVDVIAQSKKLGLMSLPGFFTPTEAFAALGAGADCLKIFPGELATAAYVKAITAVLPKATRLLLVGGVSVENIAAWKQSAIAGFGIGSSLFKPGDTATAVEAKARAMIDAYRGGH